MSTGLERAHEAMRLRREAGIKVEHIDPIEKARRSPTSLRAAINGKCWDCQGGGHDAGCRERIGSCPISMCPLYPVRPYQKGGAS